MKVQAQVIEVQVNVKQVEVQAHQVYRWARKVQLQTEKGSGMGQMMKEVQLLAEDVQYRDGPNDISGTVTDFLFLGDGCMRSSWNRSGIDFPLSP